MSAPGETDSTLVAIAAGTFLSFLLVVVFVLVVKVWVYLATWVWGWW